MHTGLPRAALLKRLDIHCAWYSSWMSWHGLSAITELSLTGIHIVREPTMATEPVTSLASLGLASMLSLTVLRINNIQHLQSLSGLSALPSSLSTLVVTKCSDLTQAGCMVIGTMHSLVELSFTECGLAPTVPSLTALTQLVTLRIDLHDNDDYTSIEIDEDDTTYDSSCYTEIPEIPPSLRRLRFHSENSYQALERPQLDYMRRLAADKPHLTELSISYWDMAWVSGVGIVPYHLMRLDH